MSYYAHIVLLELKIRPMEFLKMGPHEQAFLIASLITQSDELKKIRRNSNGRSLH